jgi:uncharacterized membrane protein
MSLTDLSSYAAKAFELLGVLAIVAGTLMAVARLLLGKVRSARDRYRQLRDDLGAGILLGLQLLVAADIVRTITEAPTLGQLMNLGLIVLIRTFLSFAMEIELEGHWPWKRPPREGLKPSTQAPSQPASG